MHTILITGGHHNSALVVAQELRKRGHKVVWVGHRHSSRGDESDSAEYLEVTASKIPFYDLTAARLDLSLGELLKFPLGLYSALNILRKIRPTAILSFGGYLGGTVALCAKLLSLPIYLHEQTVTAGRANKLIGSLASRIYLTWEQSARHFESAKVKVVGLPLQAGVLQTSHKKFFTRKRPTLLIMGGKQGAHVINQFIFTHISELLKDFNLIHQTGTNSKTQDYQRALALQSSLGSLSDCYHPVGYIGQTELGSYLGSTDLYFGRSGAHITYELGVLGLKSILTPLMWTHDHEQHQNAQILVKAKQGLILAQSELSYPHFKDALDKLKLLKQENLNLPRDATKVLVDDFLEQLQ